MVISAIAKLICFLLLSAPSLSATDGFEQCLLSRGVPSDLLFSNNTDSYTDTLRSTARNARFLFSSSTITLPLFIVKPTKAAHSQATVICSRQNGLRLRIRSGGHDYEGMSYVSFSADQFVVLDLSGYRNITIDYVQGTAWVQAGATVGELYYAIAKNNRTVGFPAGTCPTLGIGGHFSGGGIGTMLRKYGTSADNIVDAELVDVNGHLLTKETMGSDLFWAIRGGGAASFSVVLSYKIKLVSVPSVVTTFDIFKTLNQGARDILDKWQNVADKWHENLFIRPVVQAINDGQQRRIQVQFNSLYLGECKQLVALMGKSFPELGLQGKDCNQMSWLESALFFAGRQGAPVETLLDRRLNHTSSFKHTSDLVTEPIPRDGLENIFKFMVDAKDQPLTMILEPFGGKMSLIPESEIPFPHRKGIIFDIQYLMNWGKNDPAMTQGHLDWMKKMYEFMTPYVSSNPRAAYYNYKDIDLGRNDENNPSYQKAVGWGTRYFKDNFRRLALVKGKVDPQNFFRNEQSIPPLLHVEGPTETTSSGPLLHTSYHPRSPHERSFQWAVIVVVAVVLQNNEMILKF